MRTNFFLPAIAIVALMLLSFTTNKSERHSISQLDNGNYLLQNVPLTDRDINQIDNMAENINLAQQLEDMGGVARGFWLFRNKKHDDNHFTERTFVGSSVMNNADLNEEQAAQIENASQEIRFIMEQYMN